jgi:DNA mismatch repair protein MutL
VVEIADEFKYIGQAMKTYLIFEKSGDLFFIDQHAAHERLLFDLLYDKAVNGIKVSQPLLIPYVLNLNSIELGYFESRKEYLEELGFVVEDFGGGSYKVTEVPVDVAEMRLDVFFAEMLADVSLRQEKIPSAIREKLCQRACKSAIKAGFELSRSEIDALMLRLNGDMGLKCPHGRPIAVRITGTEIEKWFKRIV